jgi:hypothetical protein
MILAEQDAQKRWKYYEELAAGDSDGQKAKTN